MSVDEVYPCLATLFPDPFGFTLDDWDAGIDALTGAGAAGMSLWSLHHIMAAVERPADELAAQVAAAGLEVVCIEAAAGWANAASADAAVADLGPNLDIAGVYGASIVAAVLLDPQMHDPEQTVANLAAMADEAARRDVTIAIEYLPWTGISDIGTCWDLIRRCERDNVGFVFDSWHWHRQPGGDGEANAEILRSIPGERITVFQICDAGPDPQTDPMAECMSDRPLPGEGVIDFDRLLALFAEIGADPVVSPEVFNADLAARGPAAAAAAIAAASRSVLRRA